MTTVWLIMLWLLWAICLFGGFLFGKPNAEGTRRMPRWTRMVSSFVLVIAAWSLVISGPMPVAQLLPFVTLIAVGMTFGFVGDLALADLLRLHEPTIGGIIGFALGHIAYIGAIWWLEGQYGYTASGARIGALIVWLLIGALGWYVLVYRGGRGNPLIWAALPYALLLSATVGSAAGLAVQAIPFGPLALGTALFLTSDLILAAQLFSGARFRLIDDVVWLTYGPAQMLIVYGLRARKSITSRG